MAFAGCLRRATTAALLAALSQVAEPPALAAQAAGIVVDDTRQTGAGARAGILAGDLLTGWERRTGAETTSGVIRSVFDLALAEVEQADAGTITLVGSRGGAARRWAMPPGAWWIDPVPYLPGPHDITLDRIKPLFRQRQIDAAVQQWRQLAETLGADPAMRHHSAELLFLLATRARGLARWNDADASFEQALASAGGRSGVEALINREWGRAFTTRSLWDRAAACLERALDLNQSNAAHPLSVAEDYNALADLAFYKWDLPAARKYLTAALELRERHAPGSLAVARTLYELGNALGDAGELETAEAHYRQALAMFEKLVPGSLILSAALYSFGYVNYQRGKLDVANEYLKRAEALQMPGTLPLARTHSALGAVALGRSDLDTAEDRFRRALALFHKLAPGLDEAGALADLGSVATERGSLTEAESFFQQSLAIERRLAPDSMPVSQTLLNLSTIAADRGDLAVAEERIREAVRIQERVAPDSIQLARSLSNLGAILADRGDPAGAADYYSRALALFEKQRAEGLEVAGVISNLGSAALQQGDPKRAEAYFTDAEARSARSGPDTLQHAAILTGLASVASNRGDLPAALAFLDRARAIGERVAPGSPALAGTLTQLGEASRKQKNLAGARGYYERALKIVGAASEGSHAHARVEHGLGLVARDEGRAQDALAHFSRAIEAADKVRGRVRAGVESRARTSGTLAAYYFDALDLLVRGNRPREAFDVAERARARVFLVLLSERSLLFGADLPADLARQRQIVHVEYDRLQRALEESADPMEVQALAAQLRDARERREALADRLVRASPRLASLEHARPLSFREAVATLDAGTLLLVFVVGEDATYLFALLRPEQGEPDADPYVARIDLSERGLRDRILRFRALVQTPGVSQQRGTGVGVTLDAGDVRSLSSELFTLLIRPVEPLLHRASRLAISPDGPLHLLPFGALWQSGGADARPAGRYLIEAMPIHVVLSASAQAGIRARRAGARRDYRETVIALGDPVSTAAGARRELGPLPGARAEVLAIQEIFGSSARGFLGPDATETRARTAGEARYVHFATHGLLDPFSPLDSGLVLSAGADGQNGLLQAWEIFDQLRVDADLVTLSACETGLGAELRGEGLLGLTQAFLYAGSASVLGSLWRVQDQSAATLMTAFYRALKAGKPKDEALRDAQLATLRSAAAHPAHWAPFVLYGDRR